MICRTCHLKSRRIRVVDGHDSCTNCGGLGESGGPSTDNSLTRNSFRIRQQQKEHEADFIPPHRYDKATRKLVPNQEYIKHYPTQAQRTLSPDELKGANSGKLAS